MSTVKPDYDPYVCDFPRPYRREYRAGDRWICPNCGTTYRLGRPRPWRWWRNWAAPDGQWKVTR